jgi:hypothetical protein
VLFAIFGPCHVVVLFDALKIKDAYVTSTIVGAYAFTLYSFQRQTTRRDATDARTVLVLQQHNDEKCEKSLCSACSNTFSGWLLGVMP